MRPTVCHELRWPVASCFPRTRWLVKGEYPLAQETQAAISTASISHFQHLPVLGATNPSSKLDPHAHLPKLMNRVSMLLGSSQLARYGFLQLKRAVSAGFLQSGTSGHSIASPTTTVPYYTHHQYKRHYGPAQQNMGKFPKMHSL